MAATDDPLLRNLTGALSAVGGLDAVVLGGSRGRGTQGPHSDYDFGLYYSRDHPLDIDALREAIRPLVDDPRQDVVQIGEWGPWINGGGGLTIGGAKVDFLYRELNLVEQIVEEAHRGHFTMHYQVGHPHGFSSHMLMGKAATCRTLADPTGRLNRLKSLTRPLPPALRDALITRFGWEVGFATDNARLAMQRGEQNHVAGCVYRALSCAAQVIYAINRLNLINEKGAVNEAAACPVTVPGLAGISEELWAFVGQSRLNDAVAALGHLNAGVARLVEAEASELTGR